MTEKIFKILILILMVLYLIVAIIKRFVYYKPKNQHKILTENYIDITYRNIHCWKHHSDISDKIVIICHGNSGNISYYNDKIEGFKNLGYSVLIFDYAGFGKSPGIPSENQTYIDVSYILSMVLKTYKKEDIILYGFSMGGPIATYAARRFDIKTLILESPLTGINEYIKIKYPYAKIFAFMFNEYNIYTHLKGYKGRILLMYSQEDEVIHHTTMEKLREYTDYYMNITGTHSHSVIDWNGVRDFIENL